MIRFDSILERKTSIPWGTITFFQAAGILEAWMETCNRACVHGYAGAAATAEHPHLAQSMLRLGWSCLVLVFCFPLFVSVFRFSILFVLLPRSSFGFWHVYFLASVRWCQRFESEADWLIGPSRVSHASASTALDWASIGSTADDPRRAAARNGRRHSGRVSVVDESAIESRWRYFFDLKGVQKKILMMP
jgi:hypothetical protein